MNAMRWAGTDTASPIDDFSRCHVGIVAHLLALAELPALLEPAAKARRVADETVRFFRDVVRAHHADEERELFTAVLASATRGDEHERVRAMVAALTEEHRDIESAWARLEPKLKAVARGQDTSLAEAEVAALVDTYVEHARYEERAFLPLAQAILGRDGHHLAALGVSLHMRHVMPEVMQRFAGRI